MAKNLTLYEQALQEIKTLRKAQKAADQLLEACIAMLASTDHSDDNRPLMSDVRKTAKAYARRRAEVPRG